jgi:hypothetical protein
MRRYRLTLQFICLLVDVSRLFAQPPSPNIGSVTTAYGANAIAQNTWIVINGVDLTPKNTPQGGVFWHTAPEFAQGRMPTQLGGVSVISHFNRQ